MAFSFNAAMAQVRAEGKGVTYGYGRGGGTLLIVSGLLTLEQAQAEQSAESLASYGPVTRVAHEQACPNCGGTGQRVRTAGREPEACGLCGGRGHAVVQG